METLEKTQTAKKVILPKRKNFDTPRILVADAYTIGSDKFQSDEAKEKSVYYIVFRRSLIKINPDLYEEGDDRIVFAGVPRIIDRILYEPVTHAEIDLAKEFLSTQKITTKGLKPYNFPEHLWRRVVDEFNGYAPIMIEAMPEGSIVYPGEPVVQITSMVDGFGELAAWFESKILQCWSVSERETEGVHWMKWLKSKVREVDPTLSEAEVSFLASTQLTDFGDRAGMNSMESEDLGMAHLVNFPGTDTFCGAFQAWMNSNKTVGLSMSVNALAHRNVQAYEREEDCYNTMYDRADDGEILSMVLDCYDFENAAKKDALRLALKSQLEKNGKIVVGRPDSGDPIECVMFLCKLAVENGLYEEKEIAGKKWKFATFLKFIEGDGLNFSVMKNIVNTLMKEGFAFYAWGLCGCGGGLRNNLKRDNFGAKYALCAKGKNNIPVVKLSETIGKTTLPGPFKVLRTKEALENKKTIVFSHEPGENAMVILYNGINIWKPFGPGQDENFLDHRNRLAEQFDKMPKNLQTKHGAPASDEIIEVRKQLIKKYAPNKDLNLY